MKLFSLTVAVLFLPSLTLAQPQARELDSNEESDASSERELADHYFIPSDLVPDPFVTTHFGQSTGFGFASLHANEFDEETGEATGEKTNYNLAAFALGLDMQLGLTDFWAIRGAAAGQIFSGADANAALQLGAAVGYSMSAGTTFSTRIGDRLELGVGFDLSFDKNYNLQILNALSASIAAGKVDTSTLLIQSSALGVAVGPRVALGVSQAIGLTAFATYEHNFTTTTAADEETTDDAGQIKAGAAASIDLRPIPVGFQVAYAASIPTEGEVSHEIGGGIQYTGRRSLALGVEGRLLLQPLGAAGDLSAVLGMFRLRYYW